MIEQSLEKLQRTRMLYLCDKERSGNGDLRVRGGERQIGLEE